MTKIIAGIISAIGNILSFTILKPGANTRKTPQALKSEIINGVVNGNIKRVSKKIINWGISND